MARTTKKAATSAAGEGIVVRGISITNFLGIVAFDAEFPPTGAVIEGRNGSGKSSILKAIKAALEGQGIDPTAIHVGAQKGEIRVDLGHVSVRRVITEKGTQLKIVRTDDGAILPAPQTYLRDLLGVSTLDPLAFWRETDPKLRRAALLDALPVSVTPTMLRAWVDGAIADAEIAEVLAVDAGWFTGTNEDQSLPGHGLDLVARVRTEIYNRRTEQNRRVKSAAEELRREELASGAIVAELAGGAPLLTTSEAQAALDSIRADEAAIEGRRRAAVEATKGRDRMKEQATRLRAQALTKRAESPALPSKEEIANADAALATAEAAEDSAAALVRDLTERLAAARSAEDEARRVRTEAEAFVEALEKREHGYCAAKREAEALDAQAVDIEGMVGDLPALPTDEEAAALATRKTDAEHALARARRGEDLVRQDKRVSEAKHAHGRAKLDADRLTKAVDALTHDATRELLASTPGLEGIEIEGDVIKLGGVALDDLCGAEQMRFAVKLAKALNSRGKILLVDGLETVDPDQLPSFIEEATRDGYQLLAARVAAGDPRTVPIAPVPPAMADPS